MWIFGIVFLAIFVVLPIAGILAWHAQEMAKVKALTKDNISGDELSQMKREVTELRQMITSLAINVENMKDNYVHVSALEDRMKVGE